MEAVAVAEKKLDNIEMTCKGLLIIIDRVDLKSIDPILLKKCDRVAMTPDAILALEESNLTYFTFDDFYSRKQFISDNSIFNKATEDFFTICDEKYKLLIGFPRAFRGNIYWFLHFFADVFYISKVCKAISNVYEDIYIVGNLEYMGSFKVDLDFSSEDLSFTSFATGINSKVNMLKTYFSGKCKCIWLNQHNNQRPDRGDNRGLFNSLKHIAQKILRIGKKVPLVFRYIVFKRTRRKRNAIFVIQDGYEVSLIKRQLLEFLFIDPVDKIFNKEKHVYARRLDLEQPCTKELKEFVNKWFVGFHDHIFRLFKLYHYNILCRLSFVLKRIEVMFDYYKPIALFYSISSNKIYEDVFAYIANQRGIPVFYFQHGGTSIFFRHPYQCVFEQNKHIKKVNILQSRLEKDLLGEKVFPESQVLGSSSFYNLALKCSKNNISKRRKILYCPAPFNSYAYKDLVLHVSDREIVEVNKDIVKTASHFLLGMDIKVNDSANGRHSSQYFKNMIKNWRYNKTRVLANFPVEEIIDNYGLLILDSITTALLPTAIALNMPVIMYLKDTSYLREEPARDLRERFYFVENKLDLEKCVRLYASGKLDSKFSADIVDKYAFPIISGDPCVEIANYVRRKVS